MKRRSRNISKDCWLIIVALGALLLLVGCNNQTDSIQSQNQGSDGSTELEAFSDDGFSISIDTSIWEEESLDSGIHNWKGTDEDNFVEVGHMSSKPGIDQMVQLTLQRNGIEEMEVIEIPKDTPFTYAIAMEKENGYRLELYFTDILQDETYFLVACCFDPMNEQMRDSTHELAFSFELIEKKNAGSTGISE